MHVRLFTINPNSQVNHRDLYGIIDKINYLKELGVNAIELMPIFAFMKDNSNINPITGEKLKNVWVIIQ